MPGNAVVATGKRGHDRPALSREAAIRRAALFLLTLLAFHPLLAGAQVYFDDGIIFEDGFIFHSRAELDHYHLERDLYQCSGDQFYSRQSKDAPGNIAATLAQADNAALVFRTCIDKRKNTHYFARQL